MMMMKKIRRREEKTFKTRSAVQKFFGWRYLAQQLKLPSESKTTARHPQRDTPMNTHTHERARGERIETRIQSENIYYNKTHNFPMMAQVLRTSLKAFDTIL